MSNRLRPSLRMIPLVMIAVSMLLVASAGFSEEIDRRDEVALQGLLQGKVKELLQAKNEDGDSYMRGSYSRHYQRVDDDTYEVVFHKDTAGEERLTTERYLLTLKRTGGHQWEIASEDLKGSYDNVTRRALEDEDFFLFDKFHFEKEGIQITATNGSLIQDYLDGEATGFSVASADLAWEYDPPMEQDSYLSELMKREYPEDILIEPDLATLFCDVQSCQEILQDAVTGLRPAEKEDLYQELGEAYDEYTKDNRKARKDNPFSGFWTKPEKDNRFWSVSVTKRGFPEKSCGLSYDNFRPMEVRFFSSEHGPLYGYHPEEAREGKVSLYELEKKDDHEARDYDMVGLRGTVELALGDAETMTGDVQYSMITKRALQELPFFIIRRDLKGAKAEAKRPSMMVNSVQGSDETELTWVKLSPFGGVIILPEEVPEGTELNIRVQFTNSDAIQKLTSTYSYMSRGGWLPFVRFGDTIDFFDLTVKVPDRYKTLGIGHKVEETAEDGVSTTRWTTDSGVDFPTVIFGVYEEARSKVKATKMDGTEIPVTAHLDRDSISMNEMSLKSLQVIADEAANAINLYREIFGVDYPYGKLDLVNDPLGGFYGQAPSSIIYLGQGVFLSEGFVGSFLSGDLTRFNKSVVPHEVAHQWWGSVIANANSVNYWFVESLAEYSSALFMQAAYGEKSYNTHVDGWRRDILDYQPMNSVQSASYLWTGGFGGYLASVYAKGPYAFHILRETVGDEKFFEFLKNMMQDLEGEDIVTRDIQRAAEKAFGGGMEWFFDQWIRGVGMPEITVSYSVRQREDGKYIVEGEVTQKLVVGKDKDVVPGKYFQGIVPITVELGKNSEARLPVVLKGETTPFKFEVPKKPRRVVVNKYGELLTQDVVVKQL